MSLQLKVFECARCGGVGRVDLQLLQNMIVWVMVLVGCNLDGSLHKYRLGFAETVRVEEVRCLSFRVTVEVYCKLHRSVLVYRLRI